MVKNCGDTLPDGICYDLITIIGGNENEHYNRNAES